MNRIHSRLEHIDLFGKLADLKEQHYHHTLALSALIEVLIEKGHLTEEEIRSKAALLDETSIPRPPGPTA